MCVYPRVVEQWTLSCNGFSYDKRAMRQSGGWYNSRFPHDDNSGSGSEGSEDENEAEEQEEHKAPSGDEGGDEGRDAGGAPDASRSSRTMPTWVVPLATRAQASDRWGTWWSQLQQMPAP